VATTSTRSKRLAVVTSTWAIVALWASTVGAQTGAPSGVYDWTGFYIGGNVGGAAKRQSTTLSIENDPNNYFSPAAVPGVENSGSRSEHRPGTTANSDASCWASSSTSTGSI
jgi:outer membrane immunogenic protein